MASLNEEKTTGKRSKTMEELVNMILEQDNKALKDSYEFKRPIKNVAVIGAGPSGLPTARHLRDLGMNVRVFERNSNVGGVWNYTEKAPLKPKIPSSRLVREIDPEALSVPSNETVKRVCEITPETLNIITRKCPPSACYRDLNNNIATQLFAYPDYQFPKGTPPWCRHDVTLKYFEDYTEHFDLLPLIEFDTSVDRVKKNEDGAWELTLSKYDVYPSGLVRISRWKETFDAVVVASGSFQEPFIPDFKHLTAFNKMWPNKVFHSKQFKRPEDFKDKDVLVVGGSISAIDIVRLLDGIAKSVTISIHGEFKSQIPLFNLARSLIPKSVIVKSTIASFSDANDNVNQCILFNDGSVIKKVDGIIFCTGYATRFDFLGDLVIDRDLEEARKEMLDLPRPSYKDTPESHLVTGPKFPLNTYRDIFLMSDPTLAFVGLAPFLNTPPHFDSQAHVVARVWSGNALLPSKELMDEFTRTTDLDIAPSEIISADRKRRELCVSWVNCHAKALGKQLPDIKNFDESFESESKTLFDMWPEASEKTIKETKERIRNIHLL